MRFTVLTPAGARPAALRRCVESVLAQEVEVEHLVAEDPIWDGARPALAAYDHLQWLPSLEAGLTRARGDALLILDGEARLLPGALSTLAQVWTGPEPVALGACRMLDPQGRPAGTRTPLALHLGLLLRGWLGPLQPTLAASAFRPASLRSYGLDAPLLRAAAQGATAFLLAQEMASAPLPSEDPWPERMPWIEAMDLGAATDYWQDYQLHRLCSGQGLDEGRARTLPQRRGLALALVRAGTDLTAAESRNLWKELGPADTGSTLETAWGLHPFAAPGPQPPAPCILGGEVAPDPFAEGRPALLEALRQHRPSRWLATGLRSGPGLVLALARALDEPLFQGTRLTVLEAESRRLAPLPGVDARLALSVPRSLIPEASELHQRTVTALEGQSLQVEHPAALRARLYLQETRDPTLPEDGLGAWLDEGEGPAFLLLDGPSHLGLAEFGLLQSQLGVPALVALAGTDHIRHRESLIRMVADSRFTLLARFREGPGLVFASFTPER